MVRNPYAIQGSPRMLGNIAPQTMQFFVCFFVGEMSPVHFATDRHSLSPRYPPLELNGPNGGSGNSAVPNVWAPSVSRPT